MTDSYRVQANKESQTILRRRIRKEDVEIPVISTASLASSGRVMIGNEELVTYTGFDFDIVGQPVLTGCTRGANREQGSSGARDWPGGTFVIQAPYEKPELVSSIPAATLDQAGRQVFLDELEPELSFFGEEAGQRDITTPDQWNATYVDEIGEPGTADGQFDTAVRGVTFRHDFTGQFIYVTSDHRVQKFTSDGVYEATLATFGSVEDDEVDTPWGITWSQASLYVADSGNERTLLFLASDSPLGPLGGGPHVNLRGLTNGITEERLYGARGNQIWVNGPVTAFGTLGDGLGEFNSPTNLASILIDPVLGMKRLYVADTGNHRIQVVDNYYDGGPAQLWFPQFTFGELGTGRGQFNSPTAVAIDAVGNLYVVDSGNHRIQVFNKDGKFIGLFGKRGSGPGEFLNPTDITISIEHIYVADSGNLRVQRFTNPIGKNTVIGAAQNFVLYDENDPSRQVSFKMLSQASSTVNEISFPALAGKLARLEDTVFMQVPADVNVTNTSIVTYVTTATIDEDFLGSPLIPGAGWWTYMLTYVQAFSATTVATWGAHARFNGTEGISPTFSTASVNGSRSAMCGTYMGQIHADGETAYTFSVEFRRNASFAATPTTESGWFSLLLQKEF